jgi:hypothetical protein
MHGVVVFRLVVHLRLRFSLAFAALLEERNYPLQNTTTSSSSDYCFLWGDRTMLVLS